MIVNGHQLKCLRQARKLSREALARATKRHDAAKAGISTKTIQRLEENESRESRSRTIELLAHALDVQPASLIVGKLPAESLGSISVSAAVSGQVQLSFDSVARRYNVSTHDIVSVAPLLFTIAAEHSLQERVDAADSLETAIRTEWAESYDANDTKSVEKMGQMVDYAAAEEESIRDADLFGRSYNWQRTHGLEESPFAQYLRRREAEIDDAGLVSLDDDTEVDVPGYTACGSVVCFHRLSFIARYSLQHAKIRLRDIPDQLLEKEDPKKLSAFIEQSISQANWEAAWNEQYYVPDEQRTFYCVFGYYNGSGETAFRAAAYEARMVEAQDILAEKPFKHSGQRMGFKKWSAAVDTVFKARSDAQET